MHINLILDAEKRSASPIPLALVLRLAVAVGVLLILLVVFLFFNSYRTAARELQWAQADWKQNEPRHQAAIGQRTDLAFQKTVLEEIQGWPPSRLAWGKHLLALQQVVPDSIQLTELRISQSVVSVSNTVPVRAIELRLAGKTGEASGANVSLLRQLLTNTPAFTGLVDEASIPVGAFRQDPDTAAGRNSRVFEIVCRLRPRALE
jgi:Tfp pilus assembly protein PilN